MKNKFSSTTKDFFPIDTIVDDLIKLKDDTYVKIIKVNPINLNLKTSFEQQAIIFSYKNFLQSSKIEKVFLVLTVSICAISCRKHYNILFALFQVFSTL